MDFPFYRPIYDITADAGVEVYGRTVDELICNVVKALVNEMVYLERVEPKEELLLEVESVGFPYLLADLLNKVLYLFDVKKFLPADCEVLELKEDGSYLKLKLVGETYDPERHGKKLLIKAATYHRLKMEKEGDLYKAEIIFDI